MRVKIAWMARFPIKIAVLLVWLLAACKGGGGGPGGSLPTGGGAVGEGANFGAGPVEMPAPTVGSRDEPEDIALILQCTNHGYSGSGGEPKVECRGRGIRDGALVKVTVDPAGSELYSQFLSLLISKAYAYGYNQQFTVEGDEGFIQNIPAVAGEVIRFEIQREVSMTLDKKVLLKRIFSLEVPNVGKTKLIQESLEGQLKQFFLDEQGDGWLSSFRWTDLFMGTAHAEEPVVDYKVSFKIPPLDAGTDSDSGMLAFPGYAFCGGEMKRPDEDAPFNLLQYELEIKSNSGDESGAPYVRTHAEPRVASMVEFSPDGGSTRKIALAWSNRVFILDLGGEEITHQEILFPHLVNGILKGPGPNENIYALLGGPKGSMAWSSVNPAADGEFAWHPEPPVPDGSPRIYKINPGFDGAQCLSGFEVFNGIHQFTRLDSYGGGFSVVGRTSSPWEAAHYKAWVGGFSGSGNFLSEPLLLSSSNIPLEVAVLAKSGNRVAVAVLYSAENRLEIVQVALDHSPRVLKRINVPLDDLTIKGTENHLQSFSPVRLEVNQSVNEIAFANILQETTQIVRIPFSLGAGLNPQAPTEAMVTDIGVYIPQFLLSLRGSEPYGFIHDHGEGENFSTIESEPPAGFFPYVPSGDYLRFFLD